MDDPSDEHLVEVGKEMIAQRAGLMRFVGECLMDWAAVEFRLNQVFRNLCGAPLATADRLWNRVRSFEAKLSVIDDVVAEHVGKEAKRDWDLLRRHTRSLYAKRNQIAHATLVLEQGQYVLKPFFILTEMSPQNSLTESDVKDRSRQFIALLQSLDWFEKWFARPQTRRPQSPGPVPDLLRQIRSKDDQRLAEQRLRDLALRQYQDKKKGGS